MMWLRSLSSSAVHPASLLRLALCSATVAALLVPAFAADTTNNIRVSSRLNNIGVAYMNQQLTEKALHEFDDAHKADAAAATPLVNEGISYLYLRKLPEAEETFTRATVLSPESVRAWYGLGLTHFSGGNQEAALADFKHALTLDTHDADIHYFIGTIDLSLKRYDEAIAEFKITLGLAPLHASAHFGLARALQRQGNLDESREHLKRFQEITQSKIGTLMSASYGEQGRYATVEDMLAAPVGAGEMIPVRFVPVGASAASPHPASAPEQPGSGACVLDLEGDGSKDIVVMAKGDGLRA